MPALNEIINFAKTGVYSPTASVFRAESRSEINGRLLSWNKTFLEMGMSASNAAIISAVLGELGNNSFDHNLGQWKDQVGCLVSIDFMPDRVRVALVDRGQGIANSLRRVRPEIQDSSTLLKMAFEEVISGRSPERRGNGLKFVRQNFIKCGGKALVCLSSGSKYELGPDPELARILNSAHPFFGTVTAIDWTRL